MTEHNTSDEALANLVREVADAWTLPPQRLDAPTWRDRIAPDRRRVLTGLRLRGAVAIAIVVAISLSVAAVSQVTRSTDQGDVAASPSASVHVTPAASANAEVSPLPSPLPKLLRNGELPTPSRIMTLTGQGYRIADLATGELGATVADPRIGPALVLPRPGGGWVCICGEGQNVVQLALRTIDSNGVVGAPTPFRDIVGIADPNVSDQYVLPAVNVNASVSPDGRLGLIGWIRRDGEAGWQTGADVLDLVTLETVASTDFSLDEPASVDGRLRVRETPTVRLSPAGDRILIASPWFVDGLNSGTDHWLATFDGRSIGALTDAGTTTGDGIE